MPENILQKIKPIAAINSLKSKNLEEFILNNELTFNDGKGNGKVTYIFNKEGYEIFKDGKKIGNDGWRFSKTKQLRVFMDGKKTTWRISKNFLALSIKKGSSKAVPYFLEREDKEIAKKDEEETILNHIVQKTNAEGPIVYQGDSSNQAQSWCAILKQKLPDDRGLCVIRQKEINTFTLHFSSSIIF